MTTKVEQATAFVLIGGGQAGLSGYMFPSLEGAEQWLAIAGHSERYGLDEVSVSSDFCHHCNRPAPKTVRRVYNVGDFRAQVEQRDTETMEDLGRREWRPIPGFDGKYEINREGRVRSWKVWPGRTESLPREMKVQTRPGGYRVIQLGLHGGTHRIDDLLVQTFPEEDA